MRETLKEILSSTNDLAFTYEFTDKPVGLYNDHLWIAKTMKMETIASYDGEFEHDELLAELNTKWAEKHIFINTAELTPPYYNKNLTSTSEEIVEIRMYDPITFDVINKEFDKAQCSEDITIRFTECSKI